VETATASRRQSGTTRAWGPIGSAEIFTEGTVYTTTRRDAHHAGLARYRQGVCGGRLMELGVQAGERSPPPRNGTTPMRSGATTHTNMPPRTHFLFGGLCSPVGSTFEILRTLWYTTEKEGRGYLKEAQLGPTLRRQAGFVAPELLIQCLCLDLFLVDCSRKRKLDRFQFHSSKAI
jgi:hypothetical protein